MRIAILIALLTAVAHANVAAASNMKDSQNSMDEIADDLMDKLVDRTLKASLPHSAVLDTTTLGKPSNLGIPFQASPSVPMQSDVACSLPDQQGVIVDEQLGDGSKLKLVLGLHGGGKKMVIALPEKKRRYHLGKYATPGKFVMHPMMAWIKDFARETMGLRAYERRACELLKLDRQKKCLKFLRKRLGDMARAKKKKKQLEELMAKKKAEIDAKRQEAKQAKEAAEKEREREEKEKKKAKEAKEKEKQEAAAAAAGTETKEEEAEDEDKGSKKKKKKKDQ